MKNTVALKEEVELEVFDAEHDHRVNCGYSLVASHCNIARGITTLSLSSFQMPGPLQ